MPTPRSQQISLSDTPYYHCITRCVRRTFLCGIDDTTGKDYSHRKEWFSERLALLAETFAIDICAYVIMSNHSRTDVVINDEHWVCLVFCLWIAISSVWIMLKFLKRSFIMNTVAFYLESQLATKIDILELKGDMSLLKWMLGVLVACNIAILIKLFS